MSWLRFKPSILQTQVPDITRITYSMTSCVIIVFFFAAWHNPAIHISSWHYLEEITLPFHKIHPSHTYGSFRITLQLTKTEAVLLYKNPCLLLSESRWNKIGDQSYNITWCPCLVYGHLFHDHYDDDDTVNDNMDNPRFFFLKEIRVNASDLNSETYFNALGVYSLLD